MTPHDELSRVADSAPRPEIDHSVWDRGRALRRRDRLVTSGLALVIVAILGGLASVVLGQPRPFDPADEVVPGGAIPSRIYDVPADPELPLESNLEIGRGSVAFVADRRPIVVTATDGEYHALKLPHWTAHSVLSIAPSGAQLAWLSESATSDPTLSVLTLDTGEVAVTRILHGAGLRPGAISWSANGARVGWLGTMPWSNGGAVFGTVAVADAPTESVAIPTERALVGVAVSNGGDLVLGTQSGGLLLEADQRDPRSIAGTDGFPGQFSPDSSLLALATSFPSVSSTTLEVATGKQWRHAFPDDTFGTSTIRPVGWFDDRLQLLLVQESVDEDAEFVVTTPKASKTSMWRRSVGSVPSTAAASLTVAVDLLPDLDGTANQQLTHDFGEPEWASDRDTSWIIGLGVAATLVALAGLRWLWRRRTRPI